MFSLQNEKGRKFLDCCCRELNAGHVPHNLVTILTVILRTVKNLYAIQITDLIKIYKRFLVYLTKYKEDNFCF
jgi:hypothetical protein